MRNLLVNSNIDKDLLNRLSPSKNIFRGQYELEIHHNVLTKVQEQKRIREEQLFINQSKEIQREILDIACQPVCPICNTDLKRVRYDFLGGEINYFMGYTAYCPKCNQQRCVESDKPLGFYSAGILNGFNLRYLNFKILQDSEIIKLRHNFSKEVLNFYKELNDVVEIIVIDDRVVSIK